MSRKTNVLLIAGAALGVGTTAVAGELDLDRAYAAELRADANGRASLMQPAGGSGWNDEHGFHIGDGGNNRLSIGGVITFRYLADFRDESATIGTDNDTTIGFETPRVKLIFQGTLHNPNLSYRIDGDFQDAANSSAFGLPAPNSGVPTAGVFTLGNAYGHYNFDGSGQNWWVRWGQMKAPVLFEEFGIEDWNGQAVERSFVNEVFTGGYTQGIAVGYTSDSFLFTGVINDGARAANTAYNGAGEADFGLTGRVDFKFMGDWSQFGDMQAWQGQNAAARIGGAFHYQHMGDTNPSFASTGVPAIEDLFLYTIDGSYEGNGWGVYGAFVGAHTENQSVLALPDFDDFGAMIQAGVFLNSQWELFGRFDALWADSSRFTPGSDDDFYFLTLGVNYYFIPESHAAKFTGDVVYSFNDTLPNGGAALPDAITGLQGDIDSGEILLRLQMQLVF